MSTTCWLSRFSSNPSPATLFPVSAEVRSQLLGRPADGKGAGCCDTGPRDFKGELLNSSRPCTAGSSCDGKAGAEGDETPPPHHAHSLLSLRPTLNSSHVKSKDRGHFLFRPVPECLHPYYQALSSFPSL